MYLRIFIIVIPLITVLGCASPAVEQLKLDLIWERGDVDNRFFELYSGMTEDQVIKVLGYPDFKSDLPQSFAQEIWVMKWRNSDYTFEKGFSPPSLVGNQFTYKGKAKLMFVNGNFSAIEFEGKVSIQSSAPTNPGKPAGTAGQSPTSKSAIPD